MSEIRFVERALLRHKENLHGLYVNDYHGSHSWDIERLEKKIIRVENWPGVLKKRKGL